MSKRCLLPQRIAFLAPLTISLMAAHLQGNGQTGSTAAAGTPPVSWIDKDTGHRVIRLTDQNGSQSLYFNHTAFTPDGKQMVYTANQNIYLVDIETRESRMLVSGPVQGIVVNPKSPVVYFTKMADNRLYAADIPSGELRQIGVLPANAIIASVNADGTLIAGTYVDGRGPDYPQIPIPKGIRPTKAEEMALRVESKLPMVLFTLEISTGKITPVLHSTDWLSHLQFSPTDPSLLLYCHEGLWENVDRIWTIRTDGSKNQLIHVKSQRMEITGHEFWDEDGKTIWYDLQVPKGKAFFLASYNTETGERRRYQMDANQWSIHFNGTSSSGLFAGDGGDQLHVAKASDGEWINLYHTIPSGSTGSDQNGPYEAGVIESKHLVNLSANDYRLEPNVRFSPDHKYVIFTAMMLGGVYVYAVEVEPASHSAALSSSWRRFEATAANAVTSDAPATIQIVDHSNQPLANALVSIKSLDNGHQVGVFKTGQDGSFQLPTLDQGLHRITIICPDGRCSSTIRELHNTQITGNLVLQVAPASPGATSSAPGGGKTTVTILDANHRALAGLQFLVRTADATQEEWYKTGRDGSTSFNLPADPSELVILHNNLTYAYIFASNCSSGSAADPASIGCFQIGDAATIALPR